MLLSELKSVNPFSIRGVRGRLGKFYLDNHQVGEFQLEKFGMKTADEIVDYETMDFDIMKGLKTCLDEYKIKGKVHYYYLQHFDMDRDYRGNKMGGYCMQELFKYVEKPAVILLRAEANGGPQSHLVNFYSSLGYKMFKDHAQDWGVIYLK